ncbi:MAG: Rrf2 family transcriptional regulator [Ruminococcaceae bacterium]|nr:Rrf2 family transcriptional regulator [Oscillospiraceae bacterium]
MIVSTRGRYAIRVLCDLAENRDKGFIPMKEIAKRQGISLKYIERILPVLTKNGYIEGLQGRGGGYKLTKAPEEYIIGDLLRLTEGSLAPVACLEEGAPKCKNAEKCPTLKMWSGLNDVLNDYFDKITLGDLITG